MDVAQAGGGGRSSSVELSSPPSEPSEHPPSYPTPPNNHINNPIPRPGDAPNSTIRVGAPYRDFDDAASRLTSATPQPIGGTSHTPSTALPQQLGPHPPPPTREKKPRKKREPNLEKREAVPPRKPRNSAGVAAYRRKIKPEPPASAVEVGVGATAPRQSKISDLITPHPEQPTNTPITKFGEASALSPNSRLGFSMQGNAMQNPPTVYPQMQPPQQTYPSPQRTSGLNYDPVRSMTISAPSTPSLQNRQLQSADTNVPRPVFSTTASPAISNEPEPQLHLQNPQNSGPRFPSSTPGHPPPSYQHFLSEHSSQPAIAATEPTVNPATTQVEQPNKPAEPSTMDLDSSNLAPTSKPTALAKKGSSGSPSNADHSPGPRAKPAPQPLPQGSGLLSSAMFGGDTAKDVNGPSTSEAPNIILHVDLKGKSNVVINFARMAEEKYGFEALYPRLAKNRARLAKVAEAGEALEKAANGAKLGGTSAEESGEEDMSVDIDRESENDGDIAMSGINGGTATGANSETDGKGTKRKRRKKVEEYDQEDDFVDDSELAWEQQAAASKDGFFVYCGPLVPGGEKPAVDQPGGEPRRGRGGGRGRGRGRGASSATGEPGGRGLAPSSRGGGTTRKPRVTKAGRAVLDREKQEREKMAPLAAKPSGYPA